MPQITGISLLDTIKSVKARSGEEGLAKILARVDRETQLMFKGPIDSGKWYSLDAFVDFLETDIRETAGGNREVLIERSKAVIASQLHGINAIFVKMGSPKFVINRISAIHESYFQGIQIIPEIEDGPRATIKYLGFAKHHQIMEYAIIGFYVKALEVCGAKEISTKFTISMAEGAPYSELQITWA